MAAKADTGDITLCAMVGAVSGSTVHINATDNVSFFKDCVTECAQENSFIRVAATLHQD